MNQINFWVSAMKFFGFGIDRDVACSINYAYFNECYDGANQGTNGSFVLCFSTEGLHDNDDEFRSCMALDGTTTQLNFTIGLASS